MSNNEETPRRKPPQGPQADVPDGGGRVSRKAEEFEPSSDDNSYEMDPETKAAFERVMEKHHKTIQRLAKM